MPIFNINSRSIQGGLISLTGGEARHLSRVLRAKEGESLRLTDEAGNHYEGVIQKIQKDQIQIGLLRILPPCPLPHPIHLFLSLLKGEKMEWVVQKAVELNIQGVHFVTTLRSVCEKMSPHKWQRLERIAAEAQKQCGRGMALRLFNARPLSEALAQSQGFVTKNFIGAEQGVHPKLKDLVLPAQASYGLWIGPEGGWDPAEIDLALEHGAEAITLGPLILRAETAALHALSSLITLIE